MATGAGPTLLSWRLNRLRGAYGDFCLLTRGRSGLTYITDPRMTNGHLTTSDELFMRRALELARRAGGEGEDPVRAGGCKHNTNIGTSPNSANLHNNTTDHDAVQT